MMDDMDHTSASFPFRSCLVGVEQFPFTMVTWRMGWMQKRCLGWANDEDSGGHMHSAWRMAQLGQKKSTVVGKDHALAVSIFLFAIAWLGWILFFQGSLNSSSKSWLYE